MIEPTSEEASWIMMLGFLSFVGLVIAAVLSREMAVILVGTLALGILMLFVAALVGTGSYLLRAWKARSRGPRSV